MKDFKITIQHDEFDSSISIYHNNDCLTYLLEDDDTKEKIISAISDYIKTELKED